MSNRPTDFPDEAPAGYVFGIARTDFHDQHPLATSHHLPELGHFETESAARAEIQRLRAADPAAPLLTPTLVKAGAAITRSAIAELDAGKGTKAATVADLINDLRS